MKNRFLITLVLPIVFLLASCMSFEDPEPQTGEDEMRELVLYSQYNSAMFMGSDFARFPLVWMQQLSGVRGSHLMTENYEPLHQSLDDVWRSFYNDLMQSFYMMELFAHELDAKVFKGITLVHRAFLLNAFTDAWGDVPFYESSKYYGGGSNPVYDSQEELYLTISQMLEQGLALLENPGEDPLLPRPSEDVFFEGSVERWKKLARLVQLRHSLRLGNHSGDYSMSLLLLQQGGFFDSAADDMFFPFSAFPQLENPWNRFDFVVGNTRIGKKFADMLHATQDPRLPRYIRMNTQNQYLGAAPGSANFDASRIANASGSVGSPNAPFYLLTYCEQKFIEAEVYYRHGWQDQADAAYNEAVIASLAMHNARNAEWEAEHANRSGVDLEDIITAKYIALFLNPEVWSDWRRTGYPEILDFPPANSNDDRVPRRLIYPATEEQTNPTNYPREVDVNTRVWWDVE